MSLILKKYQLTPDQFIFPKQNKLTLPQSSPSIQDNLQTLLQKYPHYQPNELEQYLYDFDGDRHQVEHMLQNQNNTSSNQLIKQYGSLQTIFDNLSLKKNDNHQFTTNNNHQFTTNNNHQFTATDHNQFPNQHLKQYFEKLINQLTTYTDKHQATQFLTDQFLQYPNSQHSQFQKQLKTLEHDNQILKKAFRIQNNRCKEITQKLKNKKNQDDQQNIQKFNTQLQKKVQQLNTENFNLKLRIQLMEQSAVQNQNQQIL